MLFTNALTHLINIKLNLFICSFANIISTATHKRNVYLIIINSTVFKEIPIQMTAFARFKIFKISNVYNVVQ